MNTTHVLRNILANVNILRQRIDQNHYEWDDLMDGLQADALLLPENEHGRKLRRAIDVFAEGPELSDVMDAEQVHAWLCKKAEVIRSCADRSLGRI